MTNHPDTPPHRAALIAHSYDGGQAVFVRHLSNDDVYTRGKAAFAVPGLWSTMPAGLLQALTARRTASLNGRCPSCDAVINAIMATMAHEAHCVAGDDYVRPLLVEWSRRVGRYGRGRRLRQDPQA